MAPVGGLGPGVDPQPPLAVNSRAAVGLGRPGVSAARDVSAARQDVVDALKLMGAGDRAVFRRVYAITSVKLFGIVIRILGQRDLAEDVLQEVYIRIWQRAGDFDPTIGSPITWMVTIARNRALDETRRAACARRLPGGHSNVEH